MKKIFSVFTSIIALVLLVLILVVSYRMDHISEEYFSDISAPVEALPIDTSYAVQVTDNPENGVAIYDYRNQVSDEEDTLLEKTKTIRFFDENEILYQVLVDANDTVVTVPGIPDLIRRENATFSHFSTMENGEGDPYYPGDDFVCEGEISDLYLNWELAVSREIKLHSSKTMLQKYTKSEKTPSSYAIQGGCIVIRDGRRYWVQTATRSVSEETKEYYAVKETGDYTLLLVYDYETGSVIRSSFDIPFGHGNDVEYNPDTDKIVICSTLDADDKDDYITEVDWELNNYRCYSPAGTGGFRIADCVYDSSANIYMIVVTPKGSNYLRDCPFVLYYDQNWQIQGRAEYPFATPENHYGFQGSCLYDGCYYLINFLKDNLQQNGMNSFKYARISVYDFATMTYKGSIPLGISDEIEDMAMLGGIVYLNGQIYKEENVLKYNIYEFEVDELLNIGR